ncbi:rare lipoprotein A [Cupriavidus gilardii J11]|uniref:Endolytic peptidoglycan transglycosylase RlpA n=1 Tax=Cupriavidus gilardii J11 TaxID=936133 RepID=A0A562BSD0_9BURK|nr:septal ring lytic transglycosylase RlpA family protein [Cupriavidus gilardii]TWG88188.1 rare lipoprotein A [Cupriavidus gilardii J11]
MHWLTSSLLRARRAAAYGAHAICALSLAACAVTPSGDEADGVDAASAATPSAHAVTSGKAARTEKERKKAEPAPAAAQAAPDTAPAVTGSWNLFGWGDDGDKRDESRNPLEGLRADIGTFEERGTASWYGKQFHGRKTANGERFDMGAMTAAHPSLPLDSWVLVRNLRNDKVAVLRINDRGPYHGNRVLDVSYSAAKRLGFATRGHTQVEIRRLSRTELAALGPLREPGVDSGATDGGGDGVSSAELAAAEGGKTKRQVKARKVSAKRKAR